MPMLMEMVSGKGAGAEVELGSFCIFESLLKFFKLCVYYLGLIYDFVKWGDALSFDSWIWLCVIIT